MALFYVLCELIIPMNSFLISMFSFEIVAEKSFSRQSNHLPCPYSRTPAGAAGEENPF